MSHPYESPKSDIVTDADAAKNSPKIVGVLGCLVVNLVSAACYKIPHSIGPDFSDLYEGFGVEHHSLTSMMLKVFVIFPVFSVISLCLILIIPKLYGEAKTRRKIYRVCIFNLILSILLLALSVFALYLPIFTLGSVV